jgi:hypothetical protein
MDSQTWPVKFSNFIFSCTLFSSDQLTRQHFCIRDIVCSPYSYNIRCSKRYKAQRNETNVKIFAYVRKKRYWDGIANEFSSQPSLKKHQWTTKRTRIYNAKKAKRCCQWIIYSILVDCILSEASFFDLIFGFCFFFSFLHHKKLFLLHVIKYFEINHFQCSSFTRSKRIN